LKTPNTKKGWGQAPVTHTCNRSHSGGRDHEDWGSKPVPVNSLRPYLKNPITKKGWWSGSRCRPWPGASGSMPIILATQEAEIRRIWLQDSHGK
jgi:hypothetical protein